MIRIRMIRIAMQTRQYHRTPVRIHHVAGVARLHRRIIPRPFRMTEMHRILFALPIQLRIQLIVARHKVLDLHQSLLTIRPHIARAQLLHQARHHARITAIRIAARLIDYGLARLPQHRIDAPILAHIRHLHHRLQCAQAHGRQATRLRAAPLRRSRALHQAVYRLAARLDGLTKPPDIVRTAAQQLRRHAKVLEQRAPMIVHLRQTVARQSGAILVGRLQAQQNLGQPNVLVLRDAAPATLRLNVLLAGARQTATHAIVARDEALPSPHLRRAFRTHPLVGLVAQQALVHGAGAGPQVRAEMVRVLGARDEQLPVELHIVRLVLGEAQHAVVALRLQRIDVRLQAGERLALGERLPLVRIAVAADAAARVPLDVGVAVAHEAADQAEIGEGHPFEPLQLSGAGSGLFAGRGGIGFGCRFRMVLLLLVEQTGEILAGPIGVGMTVGEIGGGAVDGGDALL